MLNVMIVDDEPFFIEGLKVLIDWHLFGFNVIATAQDGEEAIEKIVALKPDIVLTDIKMPEIEGTEVIRRCVKELGIKSKFIIISGYDDFSFAQGSMKYGVRHYLLKPVDEDALIDALLDIKNNFYNNHAPKENPESAEAILRTHTENIVTKVENYVKSNFNEEISLKMISEKFYINPVYLGQIFFKKHNLYFNDYLANIRIEHAKKLLLSTDLKIYEIAELTGFKSADYFVSKFKKIINDTPTNFRNSF